MLYPESGGGRAALVVATDARFSAIAAEHVVWLPRVEPYQPGQFYRRELPAISAVLAEGGCPDLLIIDGFVDLDPAGRPGLGAYVHAALGIPIVGVAKTAFRPATHAVPVVRGNATKPLYITAAGLDVERAAALVAAMAGRYRLPDALRRVDALTRGR